MTPTSDALDKSFIERSLRRKREHRMTDLQTDPPPTGEPTVTISEVSKVLGTTRPSIYRAVEAGKLTTYKLGDFRVTTQPQLARWKGEATAQKVMSGAQWLRYGDQAVATARAQYLEPLLADGIDPDEEESLEESAEVATGRAIARVLKEKAMGRESVTQIVMDEWAEAFQEGA